MKLVALLAVAAALAVAFLVPGSASADINGCPPAFALNRVEAGDPSGPADRNGDGWACLKELDNGRTVWIDNNVPDNTASGVTDAGSNVLVDTATGDVLSG